MYSFLSAEISVSVVCLFFKPTLTTALLVAVVSAVILAVAHRPQRYAAVVGFTVKLCVIITSKRRSHCGPNKRIH